MRTLQSYLEQQWVTGSEPLTHLYNAATGEPCASVSSRGLSLGRALEFARDSGGSALRAMSFAERGALLKAMSKVVFEAREELLALSQENYGATRSDAKFDIDGASGTLAYFASIGKKLGDRTFMLDGEAEQLTRSARYVGQHILVPRHGVAIHINAFNFPAWNLCEKAAVALLAGVPVLSKPATATAVVAVRVVELWVEAGILPAGAVSLLAGSAGDLLDHVQPQDAIVFTGSGDTARRIRGHEQVIANSVPVNVEADSLNSAILGPDVEVGSDTYEMFLTDVVRDMTQKAGQKCTAIRRVFVPEATADAVLESLKERLSVQQMGSPYERATTVSPLATKAQKEDIEAGISELEKGCTCVFGDEIAVPESGYHVAPRLFFSNLGLDTPFVHEHEVFGPVATVLSWSGDPSDLITLVRAGQGGLVSSLYSNKVDFSRELILGLAPWHGRLCWGSRKIHDQTPGPGTVLPSMVHGGPGRAGGGEELGGERGLRFYWQRTAIQADRALLERALR